MILALRPDVTFVEMRGNVDTRLRKLAEGECDALVLAAAGLDRLNRAESVHQRFAVEELCPAPGQGALALETRATTYAALSSPEHDDYVRRAVAALDDADTRFAVGAERTVLDALGGGCQVPIGAHCWPVRDGNQTIAWRLHSQVVAPDGEKVIAVSVDALAGISSCALGLQAADELKCRGALDLLAGTAAAT
jgi:hydroxymethylbilane synthase